jgi:uncharacterized protein YndB with AHSA1/START domain
MNNETTKHDLVITRVFDAPAAQVWQAWSNPEVIKQWWGPTGFTCPLAQVDFREGGTALLAMQAPAEYGGQTHYSTWHYQAIVPMQRIEWIHNLADQDGNKVDPVAMGMPSDFPQDQRQVIAFNDLGNGQTEVTVTEYGWTEGQMMEMSRMGMEQCLDKIAAALK